MTHAGSVLAGLRRLALVAAVLALVLGLGDRQAPAAQHLPELDVLVAVDTTTSMSALDDPTGSRITAARRDLLRLSHHLDTARFSVLTFGRNVTVTLPFTSDRAAYAEAVRALQVEPADAGFGSALALPVPLIDAELDDAARQDSDRIPVLVLVSDGEDTTSEAQSSYARAGARVRAAAVLGYGTEHGGVMPIRLVPVDKTPPAPSHAGRLVTDREGHTAISHLDPATLRTIATQLGGAYVQCNGSQDMAKVATALEQAAYADVPADRPSRELQWAWALLVLLLALPELRIGWRGYLDAHRAGRP